MRKAGHCPLAGEGAGIIEEAKAGFSCPPGHASDLAELVLKMYHMDAGRRRMMGLNGLEYFKKNFCREKLINELDGMINGIKRKGISCGY